MYILYSIEIAPRPPAPSAIHTKTMSYRFALSGWCARGQGVLYLTPIYRIGFISILLLFLFQYVLCMHTQNRLAISKINCFHGHVCVWMIATWAALCPLCCIHCNQKMHCGWCVCVCMWTVESRAGATLYYIYLHLKLI